jgi:hypothetical protein
MDDQTRPHELLRRTFLRLVGASGLAVVGSRLLTRESLTPLRAMDSPMIGDLTAMRQAMHVHSCFSEGNGSLQAQLSEASRNGFDVFWPTDHDWRMSGYQAPSAFHFTALTETVETKKYTWTPATTGSATAISGGLMTTPLSPNDPASSKHSLKVDMTAKGSAAASRRYLMDGSANSTCQRTNLAGQTVLVDVYPDLVGSNAWAEVLLNLSYRPATGGRAAGSYQISYRIGTAAASRTAQGLLGIVTIPLPSKAFSTVTLDPTSDAAALWPDLVATDNALVDLRLGVTARSKTRARAYFGYLRFQRSATSGDQPLQTQADMVAQYAPAFPALTIGRGVEVSGPSEHSNWFGGEQHLIDHATTKPADLVAYAADLIHQGGGLASLNHPFGTPAGTPVSQSAQDTKRRAAATKFLDRKVCGVDIVEAGYRQRGGVSLETHLALFDTFIRSGYWVTATGVNDNHAGTSGSWGKETNRFYSTSWAASTAEADLLGSLRSGRVFVGELSSFNGYLDLAVEGNPMGSVSVMPGSTSRELTVTGIDLPSGSHVEVVRGLVDYSNSADPATSVVATLPDTAFVGGTASVGIDTSTSCAVRINVVSSAGRRVGFSNPVMLLQSEPANEIPDYRRGPN